MKLSTKALIARILELPLVWALLKNTIGHLAWLYRKLSQIHGKDMILEQEDDDRIREIFANNQVLNGPFAGMRYPEGFRSCGSAIYAKLLGSYESELHTVLHELFVKDYSLIVDVGCAEGYYAIGFAMRKPGAFIYAFDIDRQAIALCQKMAEANGVAARVSFGAFCSPETLLTLDVNGKALIISDCEGYECTLFSNEVVQALANHDVIIEAHDYMKIEITRLLRERFSSTHRIREIESIDDIVKAYSYEYPQVRDLPLRLRSKIVAEGRPAIMRWLVCESKLQVAGSSN